MYFDLFDCLKLEPEACPDSNKLKCKILVLITLSRMYLLLKTAIQSHNHPEKAKAKINDISSIQGKALKTLLQVRHT